MNCFRYKEDRLPVTIIVGIFFIDVAVYFFATSFITLIAWMMAGLLFKIFIACWNHHHQHVNTFKKKILNRLLEIVYTFHTGVSTNVWVLHHNLGHHLNYLDQAKDQSAWKRKDGSTMGVVEYTLVIALTGYVRAMKVGREHAKFNRSLVQMGLINLFLLGALLWNSWINATIIFLIPMLLIYLGTCWNTYYHHAGLDTDDHLHASHNITNRLYNILSGNLGYHTAHHMKQGLHWSALPEFHKSIEKDIPPELISEKFPVVEPMIIWIRRSLGLHPQHQLFSENLR